MYEFFLKKKKSITKTFIIVGSFAWYGRSKSIVLFSYSEQGNNKEKYIRY